MKKELHEHFLSLVNNLSTLNTYSWSADYKEKELKKYFEMFYNSLQLKEHKSLIDLSDLTVETATELGFRKWHKDLYLFPLWYEPLIPIDTEITAIDGTKFIYDGKNIDNDIRFGCLAYGVEIKQKGE